MSKHKSHWAIEADWHFWRFGETHFSRWFSCNSLPLYSPSLLCVYYVFFLCNLGMKISVVTNFWHLIVQVTLGLVDGLNKLSMLQSIVLDGCPVTSEGLRAIGSLCISLRELSLSKCLGVTDEALSFLVSKHKDLRKLDITCCRKITDGSIASIANSCTALTSLKMESCTLVPQQAFVLIGQKCHYLEELDLTDNEIDDEGLNLSIFIENIYYHISCYTYLVFLQVLCPFLLVLGYPA